MDDVTSVITILRTPHHLSLDATLVESVRKGLSGRYGRSEQDALTILGMLQICISSRVLSFIRQKKIRQ